VRSRRVFALIASILLAGIAQGANGIGMVTGSAAFYVNGASVSGNATLFEGAIVKTATHAVARSARKRRCAAVESQLASQGFREPHRARKRLGRFS
jgi:hypothetical protein